MSTMDFAFLKGKTLSKITGAEARSERIIFHSTDGDTFAMYHNQDCCESVSVEDINGDISDIIGAEILIAEETTSNINPEDIEKDDQDSFTWTFYKLATRNGYVTIRWYGESNGYYSESVSFSKEA